MMRGLAYLLAIFALCGALPLGTAAADPAPKPDPRYVVTRLGDQAPALLASAPGSVTAQMQSFKFTAQGTISIAGKNGGDVRLAMTGEVAQPDRVHLTLTLSDPKSGETIPLEMVLIGKTPYIHLPKDLAPDGKDVWVLVDGDALQTLAGGTGGMSGFPGMTMPNLASLPPVTQSTQVIGDETIGGTPTTHSRTSIDASMLLGGAAKGAKPSTLTLDLWTGKSDNFPRRIAINGAFSFDSNALFDGAGGAPSSATDIVNATLSFTINFSDFNTPVTISAPTTFVKLSDLIG